MTNEFDRCPACRAEVKQSYSYCPDCNFSWNNYSKDVLAKRLKAHLKKLGKEKKHD